MCSGDWHGHHKEATVDQGSHEAFSWRPRTAFRLASILLVPHACANRTHRQAVTGRFVRADGRASGLVFRFDRERNMGTEISSPIRHQN